MIKRTVSLQDLDLCIKQTLVCAFCVESKEWYLKCLTLSANLFNNQIQYIVTYSKYSYDDERNNRDDFKEVKFDDINLAIEEYNRY